MAKRSTTTTEKCHGCHAYFVAKGELCDNCKVKAGADKADSEE